MIELTRTGKNTLIVENPVMPAAGTFGFDGAAYRDLVDVSKLGALVTNPITWRPRRVARGPRVVPLTAGVLVHTGLPNPGLRRVVKVYGPRWQRAALPVIVHVVATSPDDVARCLSLLERVEGVAGVELGLHDQSSAEDVAAMLEAATESSLLPVLARLPLYTAVELAEAAVMAGAGALVVAAPPRGTARDPETGRLVGGRVYGPWLKVQALRAVGQVARLVDVPLIGSGGIHTPDDARDFIEAGAAAVQVDSLTWVQPYQLEIIARNLGGHEVTRAIGALADEWQPGLGETMLRQRAGVDAPDDALDGAPDETPDNPSGPPDILPEEDWF